MKTAIITGASSGLGREYALALLAAHPEIECYWLIARRADRLDALAAELKGVHVRLLALDLTKPDSFEALSAALAEDNPDVKYLINNAGYGKLNDFIDERTAALTGMVELNCTALTALTSLTLPYMKAGGAILMVCSIAAFVPTPRMAVYCSTKAYVMSLAQALHYELKPRGIGVLAACPGPMDTEFLDVAAINGNSKTFNMLQRVDPKRMARRSLYALDRGRAVYTDLPLYKIYRVLGKLVPHKFLMPFTKC